MPVSPIPLSSLSQSQVIKIHETMELRHAFLLPSIIYLWFNYEDRASCYFDEDFVFGTLFPSVGENFACLSSKRELNDEQLLKAEKLIPSEISKTIRHSTFNYENDYLSQDGVLKIEKDDPSLYDFIYDVNELSTCEGKKYEDTRRHVRRFFDLYQTGLKIHTIEGWEAIASYKLEILNLFDDWTNYSTEGSSSYQEELVALELFLAVNPSPLFGNIVGILFLYNDRLIGFSINEILSNHFVINHFQKANLNLSSIGHYMFYSVAKILSDREIKYLNFQDDHGIIGLRAFKHKMRPVEVFETKKVTFLTQ